MRSKATKFPTAILCVSLVGVLLVSGCGLRNRLPKFSRNSDETLYQDPYPSLGSVPPAPSTSSSQQISTMQGSLNQAANQVQTAGQQIASAPAPSLSNPQVPAMPTTGISTAMPTMSGDQGSIEQRLAAMRAQSQAGITQLNQQQISSGIPTASLPSPATLGAPSAGTTLGTTGGLAAPQPIVSPSIISANAAPQQMSSASSAGADSGGPDGANELAVIYFQNGSSSLSRRDTLILKDVARVLQQKGGKLAIVGHASDDGKTSEEINRKMSANRAAVVARYMVENIKVPKELIIARAMGTARQIPGGDDYNRRVQIFLVN